MKNRLNNNSDNNTRVDGIITGGTGDTSTGNNNVRILVRLYQMIVL